MRRFHLLKDGVDHGKVGIGAMFRGAHGGQPLHIPAKADRVEQGDWVVSKQIDKGRGKSAAQHVSDIDTRTSPCREQAALLQVCQCFAQGRARHLHTLA